MTPPAYPSAPAVTKSPGLAAFLAILFGPLGMLYATVRGAAIMFGVNLALIVLGFMTVGIGWVLLFASWVAGIVWAYTAADQHNIRITAPRPYGYPQYPPSQFPPPAQW